MRSRKNRDLRRREAAFHFDSSFYRGFGGEFWGEQICWGGLRGTDEGGKLEIG
jgi:hypothetical protein